MNSELGQVIHGLNHGTAVSEQAYLATFLFRAGRKATGTFVIDLLVDEMAGDQTFLVSDFTQRIAVTHVEPATVHVK